jgi:perosamine synthetase
MIQLFRPYVTEAAIKAVGDVLRSGWIGLGAKTAEFEDRFATYVGARYAVALNSATAALHLALIVSDVHEGDEVLTPSLTFVSTNHVILYERANPVFVDVDDDTLNIDLNEAERLVSPKTKAVIAVHYGGNPVDVGKLYTFASRHGLRVIEDAAHACGAEIYGKKIGSFGLTCFSFHAVKNLAIGDGGMITTNDEGTYQELKRLRWMGIDRSTYARSLGDYQWEYDVTGLGYKYHLNDVLSAIGIEHLSNIDEWNRRRREIAEMYQHALSQIPLERLRFVKNTSNSLSAQHLYPIRVSDRNNLFKKLNEKGISVGVHYKPSHYYPMYRNCRSGRLSVTEQAYRELISLPMHLLLTDGEIEFITSSVSDILLNQ